MLFWELRKENNMRRRKIYLDGAANTPIDKRVLKAMKPFLAENSMGNSHGIHEDGIRAMQAVEEARQKIANNLHVMASEVYFTSGATEGNNWVLKTLAFHNDHPYRNKIVISAIEHSSILSQISDLEKLGMTVVLVKPEKSGRVAIKALKKAITKDTLLVCVMAANNETGIGNNIENIGQYAHTMGALMMADCTQLFAYGDGYMNLGKLYPHVDYFTFSGHKIYGPTGTGCLIARNAKPLYPFMSGGSQERGLRGGTHNVAGIVGLGKAVELLAHENHKEHYNQLFSYFMGEITRLNKDYEINLHLNAEPSFKNIVNLNCSSFKLCDDVASLLSLYGVECSAGAACDIQDDPNADPRPSHVLMAMEIPKDEIPKSVRISFTKYTTKKDIKYLIKVLSTIAEDYKTK